MNNRPRIVVLGGNFAGLGNAQKLREHGRIMKASGEKWVDLRAF